MRCRRNFRRARLIIWRPRRPRIPKLTILFLKGEYEEREAESTLKAEAFDQAAPCTGGNHSRSEVCSGHGAAGDKSNPPPLVIVSVSEKTELAEIKKIAERALALAPDLAEAHIALGNSTTTGSAIR